MRAIRNLTLLVLASLTMTFTGAPSLSRPPQSSGLPTLVDACFQTYPEIARVTHVTGDIKVQVTIDSNGDVADAKILNGHRLLNDASIAAARKWKFDKQINPEIRRADLTFRYTLMPRCSDEQDHTPVFHAPFTAEIRRERPWLNCDGCSPAKKKRIELQESINPRFC
jgi:TonB family protein